MKTIVDTLGVARSNVIERLSGRRHTRAERYEKRDEILVDAIRAIVDQRGSYGYRRVTALLNRRGVQRVNPKRVYRVMRDAGLLLQRATGKRTRTHEGRVVTLKSNLRWCSDAFEIRCWNGERVQVAFAMDCCDREIIGYVATSAAITGEMIRDLMAESVELRFGAGTIRTPQPLQWLSDNGPPYTAHETREFGRQLGFIVCTTPAYSPESNGMAEAFVKTFKRDYVYLHRLESASSVLLELHRWFDDYNNVHPHRGLNMRSPREYRACLATA